jgi:plastocyanin
MNKLCLAVCALAAYLAVGCAGSDDNNEPAVHQVAMTSSDTFSPKTVFAMPGEFVRWTNNDTDAHTVEPDTDTSGLDSDNEFPNGLANGQTFQFQVPSGAATGTKFFYHCRFHGAAGDGTTIGTGMAGVIVVGEEPVPEFVDVSMSDQDIFRSRTTYAEPGKTVRWTNNDTDVHSVQPDTEVPGMDSDETFPNGVPPGDRFLWTVPDDAVNGTKYFYHCRFHGTQGNGNDFGTGMVGVIVVGPAPTPDHNVSMSATDTFEPKTLSVQAGDLIRWTNHDEDAHSVKPDVATPGMDSDVEFPNGMPGGATFDFRVPADTPNGTKIFYHCRFHGSAGSGTDFGTGMVGVIQVGGPSAGTFDVMMSGSAFSPKTLTVHAGDTVKWTNHENTPHTVTPDLGTPGMNSGDEFPGGMLLNQVFSWTVPTETPSGTKFYYHCQFHGTSGDGTVFGNGMTGVVQVE